MSLNFRYRCPKGMHSKEAFCWHASLMLLPAEERFHDLPRLEGNGAAAEAG